MPDDPRQTLLARNATAVGNRQDTQAVEIGDLEQKRRHSDDRIAMLEQLVRDLTTRVDAMFVKQVGSGATDGT